MVSAPIERREVALALAVRGWRPISIARTLGLSRQRVHQILRMPPSDEKPREAVTHVQSGDIMRRHTALVGEMKTQMYALSEQVLRLKSQQAVLRKRRAECQQLTYTIAHRRALGNGRKR